MCLSTELCCVLAGFPHPVCIRMWGRPRGDTQLSYFCTPTSWVFWFKGKITKANAPIIQMDATPSRLIGAPILPSPPFFMQDALLTRALPIYPGLGPASSMLACILSTASTITTTILLPFVQKCLGELVPEETFSHSHLS